MILRAAEPDDAPRILELIEALASYEREPDAVKVDAETLRRQLAREQPPFECVLAVDEERGLAIGFALFFPTYSTWRGQSGLWLEDLFVVPERRGEGVGRRLLAHLARACVQRGYARFEWSVLDWNEPALGFYRRVGAVPMREWTTQRLEGAALESLAASSP